MFLQFGTIFTGLVISYFLKDFEFLSLELRFLSKATVFPDFLLIFVAYFALKRDSLSGLWVGFFAGMLEDSTNWIFNPKNSVDVDGYTTIIGIHALVYTLIGFILGQVKTIYENQQTFITMIIVFLMVVFARFLTWTIHGFVDDFNFNYAIVAPALYTAIIAPLWFTLLAWIYRF